MIKTHLPWDDAGKEKNFPSLIQMGWVLAVEIEKQLSGSTTFSAFGWGGVIRDNPRFVEHATTSSRGSEEIAVMGDVWSGLPVHGQSWER